MASTEGDTDSGMQKFELYIKASAIDRETKGADPICQQFFMITCLLGEYQDDVDFKVFTVQADCPPKNFAAGWSKKYPVIMVNQGRNKTGSDISGMMYDTFEDLETFFEGINRECPELKRKNQPNQDALQVVQNLFKHFNHFIAGKGEKTMKSELKKLNEFLESQETKFLVDNVLTFADCHLLPRLQHIRVAGKAYHKFDIPHEYIYIWRYLRNAYEQDAFKSTMPSDQDIVMSYEKKAPGGLPRDGGQRWHRLSLENFTYTLEVPKEVNELIDALPPLGSEQGTQQATDIIPSIPSTIDPPPSTNGQQTEELPAIQTPEADVPVTPPESTQQSVDTVVPDIPAPEPDASTEQEAVGISSVADAVVDAVQQDNGDAATTAGDASAAEVPPAQTEASSDSAASGEPAVTGECGQSVVDSLPADLMSAASINGTS